MTLDKRTISLIAVGASVTGNCQLCLQTNVTKALEDGANTEEITEAVGVGKRVRIGAASKMDELALSLIHLPYAMVSVPDCGCKV